MANMNPEDMEVNQYLTFMLDRETYAIDINRVREVLDMPRITHVPNMPDFMRGVINLRGGVVPVIDLRCKFHLEPVADTVQTCIIIIEISLDGASTLLGAVADSVREVMRLEDMRLVPPPRLGNRLKTEFIRGMINRDNEFIIVLDVMRVFSIEELEALGDASQLHAPEETNVGQPVATHS
jgi:purine-binding chemotaxis protein CheW